MEDFSYTYTCTLTSDKKKLIPRPLHIPYPNRQIGPNGEKKQSGQAF